MRPAGYDKLLLRSYVTLLIYRTQVAGIPKEVSVDPRLFGEIITRIRYVNERKCGGYYYPHNIEELTQLTIFSPPRNI